MFLNDLLNFPTDREINFLIDLFLDNHPITIPPYRMALAELKELND